MRPVKVLCIDDNDLVAAAFQQRLVTEPDLRWVGWLSGGERISERLGDLEPDIVLLDIDIPGENPFDLLLAIAGSRPDARVLMFSGHVRREYLDRAIECGAWGYVSKNEPVEEILGAIRRAAGGQFAITPEVALVQAAAPSPG
jgi:DNA-binding NarL/FixJ family response regulator